MRMLISIMILSKEKSPLSAVQNWMTVIIQKKLTEIIQNNDIQSVTVVRMGSTVLWRT